MHIPFCQVLVSARYLDVMTSGSCTSARNSSSFCSWATGQAIFKLSISRSFCFAPEFHEEGKKGRKLDICSINGELGMTWF